MAWRSTFRVVRLEFARRRSPCKSPSRLTPLRCCASSQGISVQGAGEPTAYRELAAAGIMEPVPGSSTDYPG
jgi:hypothetical protein